MIGNASQSALLAQGPPAGEGLGLGLGLVLGGFGGGTAFGVPAELGDLGVGVEAGLGVGGQGEAGRRC